MTDMTTQDLMKAMDSARFDPAGKARSVMDAVDANVDGLYRFVDPSSPFMLMWEMAGACGAHTLNGIDTMTRKRYVRLALTAEDIYLHMSDRDFLDIFAIPPIAPMTFLLSQSEIIKYAVEVTPGGMRKITMPKNSSFICNGYTFTMEYPVEFRIQPTGGMSVVYGSPINGVLHEATGNLLNWDIITVDDVPMIRVEMNVFQMTITSQVFQTNSAQVFNTRLSFTDSFHYCRAYNRVTVNGVSTWKEIKTTHTDQTFDPYDPTILLKVYSGVLDVRLPLIYLTSGQVVGEIRLDVYTTKATDDVLFDSYSSGSWSEDWLDLDDEDAGKYTANWAKLSTYSVYSDGYTSGSRAALTLEELRDRVMNSNVGVINLPITTVNLQSVLSDSGYQSVTDVDVVTKRILNATRTLPVPLDKYTVTPISAAIEDLVVRLSDLNGLAGVDHNGERVTLHPEVLFKDVDGGLTIVSTSEINELHQLKPEAMARAISSAGYRFSPFHYVLDATNGSFAVRCYYLDAPEITARQFILENPSLQLELATASTITIARVSNGYNIHLKTSSGTSYKGLDDSQIQVQLAYIPPGESTRAYLNGTLLMTDTDGDKERVWEFLLETNYDIDSTDALTLKNFSMFSDGVLDHPISLTTNFDIIYTVSGYSITDMKESDIDAVKNRSLLPYDAIGILQERIAVKLGNPLTYLWTGSRTISTAADYQTYPANVMLTYEADEYEQDADGGIKVELVDGKLVSTIINRKGDPVLDQAGVQKVKFYAGDFVRDAAGNKILVNARALARQIDMTLFDGRYYFANDQSSIDYMTQICTKMQQWATDDMTTRNKQALEKTTMYFRPLATTGSLSAIVEGGANVTIDAEQALKVVVYMTETGWKNDDLKNNIRTSIIQFIANEFQGATTSLMDVIDDIKNSVGSDVLGLRITGLGGDKNYPLVTMADDSGRMALKKKLTSLPDGTFTVEEDIDISFVQHLPARSAL